MKKIIVAGAGHGGLAAAGLLAEKGYDVTVYEQKVKGELGYDWTDAADLKVLRDIGLELAPDDSFERNGDMCFYGPGINVPLVVPSKGKGSAKVERKYLYELLLDFAEKRGVSFVFGCTVTGALYDGLRVVGIKTADGNIYGDLVIDAAGINSPVRRSLPHRCGVDRDYAYGECFYASRIYFDRLEAPEPSTAYEVFLMHMGEKGISWVITEKDCVDVLVGRMEPFSQQRLEEILDSMRAFSPQIGRTVLRGSKRIEQIPVRRPLAVMVCDGYAAVGDSAYMTVPMNGSGICASLKAGQMLAQTVINDSQGLFTRETLWEYNRRYIMHFGCNFASVDALKNILLCMSTQGIDFLFDKKIITEGDINFSTFADSPDEQKSGAPSFSSVLSRAARGMSNLPVLIRTAGALTKGDSIKKLYRTIPEKYDRAAVEKWKKAVDEATVFVEP